MKKDIALLWCEALRSGDYQQGFGRLCPEEGKFCCLGVLCEVGIKAGVPIEKSNPPNRTFFQYDKEEGRLPRSICEWSGVLTAKGARDRGKALWRLNDYDRLTFSEIADIIEKEYEEL